MTIKEVEERTGMDRANIRFYEKEELLMPTRLANGYRDYSEEDVKTLLRIKLLRSLHLSLEDIRALQAEEKSLNQVLHTHLSALRTEKDTVSAAEEVCLAMQTDRADYGSLNAEKYLLRLEHGKPKESAAFTLPKEDTLPHPAHPWRRFWARTLDYDLYLLPFELFCGLALHINPNSGEGKAASAVCSLLAYVVMIFLEPLLLHIFGTTPGKWIFGLRIIDADGTKLTYEEGLRRTWGVFRYGYGFGIPGYELYRLWQCYKLCVNGEEQDWDEFPLRRAYTIRDTRPWRIAVWFTAASLCAFLALLTGELSALPPNRGSITVAQFAENYNYLADYYLDDEWYFELMPDGRWAHHPEISEFAFYYGGSEKPPYLTYFTDENGFVTGFSMEDDNADWISLLDPLEFRLSSLALIQAQPQAGVFSETSRRIFDRFSGFNVDEYTFTESGVTVQYTLNHTEDDSVSYFFSVTKEP